MTLACHSEIWATHGRNNGRAGKLLKRCLQELEPSLDWGENSWAWSQEGNYLLRRFPTTGRLDDSYSPSHLTLTQPGGVGTFANLNWWKEKLRLREVKELTPNHTDTRWQSWDSNTGGPQLFACLGRGPRTHETQVILVDNIAATPTLVPCP